MAKRTGARQAKRPGVPRSSKAVQIARKSAQKNASALRALADK